MLFKDFGKTRKNLEFCDRVSLLNYMCELVWIHIQNVLQEITAQTESQLVPVYVQDGVSNAARLQDEVKQFTVYSY